MAAKSEKAGKESAEVDTRIIEQSNVVAPITRNGRLVNYLFITVRVELAQSGDVWKLKEKSHFLRDSLVRATHKTSLAVSGDEKSLDLPQAEKVLLAAAQEALGAQSVRAVSVVRFDSLNR